MFKQIGISTVELTPDVAREFASMPKWKGERRLNGQRKAYLRGQLVEGHFYSPEWAVAWLNGVRYRVNGQHSSLVLAEADGAFPVGLKATVKEFVCETEQDLAELFARFDVPLSARGTRDVTDSHAAVHPELAAVASTMRTKIVSGISLALTENGELSREPADQRARHLHENVEFVLWANGTVRSRDGLRRVPVMAAMYRTYHRDRAAADQFWSLVALENHPDRDDPSRVLARFLSSFGKGEGRRGGRSAWTQRGVYVKCLLAWNAWRHGDRTNLHYHAAAEVPKVF